MASSFNIYNTLTATYWKPIDFDVSDQKYQTIKTSVCFSNGVIFYLHNFLQNGRDFTFNRKTGTFLTSPIYNSYFLKPYETPAVENSLTTIYTPLSSYNGGIIKTTSTSNRLNSPKGLKDSGLAVYTKNDIFALHFEGSNVYVQNKQGNVLTINNSSLIFSAKKSPMDGTQLFDYWLGKNNIVLFQTNTNFSKIVTKSGSSYVLGNFSLGSKASIPENALITFISYKESNIDIDKNVLNSFLVKYKTTPLNSTNSLVVDPDFFSENSIFQNYLGMYPFENPTITDTYVKYPMEIHGLKNYQTPEYTYTTSNPLLTSSKSFRRIYNKIFTGTNQETGYDKIYTVYQADTKEYTFKVGHENYFYYPSTSSRAALSSVGLIEDGATAGEVPFTSDRISVFRKNYEEVTPGVPQPSSITRYDNTWACSWLSGSNFGDKLWVDRYYNAAYYTLDQVLSAKAYVYKERIYADKPFTYDVPSTMVLEPGILYKYERVGKNDSREFIKHLAYDVNNEKGGLVLSITNWLSSPLSDDSNFKNNGLVYYASPENYRGNYMVMDGKTHIIFPSNQSLLQNSKVTTSLWLNQEDWSKVKGGQVFGNYFESGFGLLNKNTISTPMFTLVNNASSVAYNVNYNLTRLSEIPIPNKTGYKNNIIQRLPDLSYWIVDTVNKTALKYNAINNIVAYIPSSVFLTLTTITQLECDGEQNLYFYDNTIQQYVKTDASGTLIASVSLGANSGYNRIEIDANNTVNGIYGTASVIDNLGNIWEVVGGNLYKNRQMFANVGFTQQITCDSNNFIWISHLQDTISLLDTNTGLFKFSYRIGNFSNSELDPCKDQDIFRSIGLVKVPSLKSSCDDNVNYEDVLIVVDSRFNKIFQIDNMGNLVSKLDIRSLPTNNKISLDFYANGDFTGYSYARKFGSYTGNLSWNFKIASPNGLISKLLSLDYDVSTLPPGWHHFAFVFDSTNGYAKYYIDSIEVNSTQFSANTYQLYYDYRASLLLGADSIGNTTLNDIIQIEDSYKYIGQVSELRMYSKSLTQGEIEQLYFSSDFAYPRLDLSWNMRVGKRNYVEEIEHWYKMQLPGSKSKYFNINIHNLNIDSEVKSVIEDAIRANINKLTPAETSLYKINWT